MRLKTQGGKGFFKRLKKGLSKSRAGFIEKIDKVFRSKKISADLIEELEEILILSDIGVDTSCQIIEEVKKRIAGQETEELCDVKDVLKSEMQAVLGENKDFELHDDALDVLLVLGVNGVGKTTTIGKLASRFAEDGQKVILAAGDTFRAAAIEQLEIWSQRADVDLIKHKSGGDPSAVAYDAVQSALARKADILIIDTAGRLHTQKNLLEELKKVRRVTERELLKAKDKRKSVFRTLLVLDATIGQNAIKQAMVFHQNVSLDGLIITKLDGTSRGGVIFSIVKELGLPVYFIGVGEEVDDLREFVPEDFVSAFFG